MSNLGKRNKFISNDNQPYKLFKTSSDKIINISSQCSSSKNGGEFLLQLITKDDIKTHCTENNYNYGEDLIHEVSNIIACDIQRSKITAGVRLTGVVSQRYNIIIFIKNESTNINFLSKADISSTQCTCGFPPVNRQYCPHIIALLLHVIQKGTRVIEFFQSLEDKIKEQSKEDLAKCLEGLIKARPDVIPIIKDFLSNSVKEPVSVELPSKVITSGNRKARVGGHNNILNEIEIDPHQVTQSISYAFDEFITTYKESCNSNLCDCECHNNSMNDLGNCTCSGNIGDYQIIKDSISLWINRVENYLKDNIPSSISNSLIIMDALVRGFVTKLYAISNNNPLSNAYLSYSKHKDHFIRNGKELCWRFCLILVRREVFIKFRELIGTGIKDWMIDCKEEFIPYIKQIQRAAFDDYQGIQDKYSEQPMIVAARLSEYHIHNDEKGFIEYWNTVNMPITLQQFTQQHGTSFHVLWK